MEVPRIKIAEKALPKPLLRSLRYIFEQNVEGCALAGGTALSGFYAGHRRSDDIDLFTSSEASQRAAVLAVKSLPSLGAKLDVIGESRQYFEALGTLDNHAFKITAVLDANLFRVGAFVQVDAIRVVDLDTLFKMKAATLVSRCSEKDLFDLKWLFVCYPEREVGDLLRLGSEIDAGVNGESMLGSVLGALLREEACDFSLDPSLKPKQVFREIEEFRDEIARSLRSYLENEPAPKLGALIRKLKRLRG